MTPPVHFHTRPARREDVDKMFACYRRTMRPHVERAWGWDEDFQRRGFTEHLALDTSEIIEVENHFAGFVWLQATPSGMMMRLICLEPHNQRRSVGSRVLSRLVSVTPGLRLKVLRCNPALALYQRLGFVAVAEDAYTVEMVHGRLPVRIVP